MARRRIPPVFVGLVAAASLAACTGDGGDGVDRVVERVGERDTADTATASAATGAAVARRELEFVDASRPAPGRGEGDGAGGRRLDTVVWYPEGDGTTGAPFPVVLFSHGLTATPETYVRLAETWAAAGFVVVAPTYPGTSGGASPFVVTDVLNQPADASFVLDEVLALAAEEVDPFVDLLDGDRVAAAGHSAGGITTVGLLDDCCRDPRLDAAVVLAGNTLGFDGTPSGTPVPVLFVHGSDDPLVSEASGRRAYEEVPWPKAFLSLPGAGHSAPYVEGDGEAGEVVRVATTAFLQWSLRGDPAALETLRSVGATPGVARLDDALIS